MSTHALAKRRPYIFKQFNWRALLVRILVNALTLAITVILTPSMGFVMPLAIWKIILLAVALGLINALIKPIIQFLTLSYIFATYGLVVIFINTIILYLLSWFLPGYFYVGNFLWALFGGAIMGIAAGFLESLFGLTLPIVDEESVSETMRKATEFNERKKQVFPFKEIEEEVGVIPIPSLEQSDSETAVIVPDATQEPVPVAASPEAAEQADALEIPVVEESLTPEQAEPVMDEGESVGEMTEAPPAEPSVAEDSPPDPPPEPEEAPAPESEEAGPEEPESPESQDDPEQGGVA